MGQDLREGRARLAVVVRVLREPGLDRPHPGGVPDPVVSLDPSDHRRGRRDKSTGAILAMAANLGLSLAATIEDEDEDSSALDGPDGAVAGRGSLAGRRRCAKITHFDTGGG